MLANSRLQSYSIYRVYSNPVSRHLAWAVCLRFCVGIDLPDPFLNGVYLDRSSVDFGFSSASGEETISLTNSSNTEVWLRNASPAVV